MTTEETIIRLNELDQLEATLKQKRDFESIIYLCDEVLTLRGSLADYILLLPLKAYCYARLGNTDAAIDSLEQFETYEPVVDAASYECVIQIVDYFIEEPVSRFTATECNFLIQALQTPNAIMITEIVFDYQDIVGPVTTFDYNRLNVRHSSFSPELVQWVFYAMERHSDDVVYYNRETNDVQEIVNGYFVSQLPSKASERRQIAQWIAEKKPHDPVIEGIHCVIPQLPVPSFLQEFRKHMRAYPGIDQFLLDYEQYILEEAKDDITTLNELYFGEPIANEFFKKLFEWASPRRYDEEKLRDIASEAIWEIALGYLNYVNSDKYPYEEEKEKYAFVRLSSENLTHLGQLILTRIIPEFSKEEMLINPLDPVVFFIRGSYLQQIYDKILAYVEVVHAIRNKEHGKSVYENSVSLFEQLNGTFKKLVRMKPEWRSQLRPFQFKFT